jgi:glycosyltransferase involved in cell wall biosynthesis
MVMPSVSHVSIAVVIPVYNPGPYLRGAIDSVLSQTYPASEIVVVNDGWDGDLESLQGLDDRIRLINQVNSGVSVARNRGIEASKAEWIAFLDQDDFWMPRKLELQVAAIVSNIDLVHTQFDVVDSRGCRTGPGYGSLATYRSLLSGHLGVLLSSALIRRQALVKCGTFDPLLRIQQDLSLFLNLARDAPFAFVASPETAYRLHGENVSDDYSSAFYEICNVFERHELDLKHQGLDALLDELHAGLKGIRCTYALQGIDALRRAKDRRDLVETLRHAIHVLRIRPLEIPKAVWKAVR